MGEAVDGQQDATQIAGLPDLTELLLTDAFGNPHLEAAMRRVVEEADWPDITAGFGSTMTDK